MFSIFYVLFDYLKVKKMLFFFLKALLVYLSYLIIKSRINFVCVTWLKKHDSGGGGQDGE